MRHARVDYDRIQDPSGLIPEDEPVFLLRGQDRHASSTLEHYAERLSAAGGDPQMVRLVLEHAGRMRAWPRHKDPDL
jgi:hypothetical protein